MRSKMKRKMRNRMGSKPAVVGYLLQNVYFRTLLGVVNNDMPKNTVKKENEEASPKEQDQQV